MIFVTGDMHGEYSRLSKENFAEQEVMTKDDYVIVCGDFGFWSDGPKDRWWRNWLADKPFTTLWVDGNHENYDLLKKYPVDEWHGGKAQKINDSVIHLMRGEIYEIDGLKFFTFGGARSHDIQGGVLDRSDPDFRKKKRELDRGYLPYRINHESWWAEEMPNAEEMEHGLENLKLVGNEVDFILTHDTATDIQAYMSRGLYKPDELTDFLMEIKKSTKYKKWFFGHYHDNQNLPDNCILIYEQMVRIA